MQEDSRTQAVYTVARLLPYQCSRQQLKIACCWHAWYERLQRIYVAQTKARGINSQALLKVLFRQPSRWDVVRDLNGQRARDAAALKIKKECESHSTDSLLVSSKPEMVVPECEQTDRSAFFCFFNLLRSRGSFRVTQNPGELPRGLYTPFPLRYSPSSLTHC